MQAIKKYTQFLLNSVTASFLYDNDAEQTATISMHRHGLCFHHILFFFLNTKFQFQFQFYKELTRFSFISILWMAVKTY